MKDKKFEDFLRFVRRFCKDNDLRLQEDSKNAPHFAYTIYDKDGNERVKIDRFIVPGNRKSIKQGSLRRILKHLRNTLEKKIAGGAAEEILEKLRRLIEELERWL